MASTKTITIGTKTFTIGDTAVYHRMWIDSDGPLEGYVAKFTAEIKGIGAKRVNLNGRSLTHERFAQLNA